MKRLALALVAGLMMVGCGQAPQNAPSSSASSAATSFQPTPQWTPNLPTNEKSVFSSWTSNDEFYSVDLSQAPLVGSDGTFSVTRTIVFTRWNPGLSCRATITIQGTQEAGTIVVGNATALQDSYYNPYCDVVEGSFTYTRVDDYTLKLCLTKSCRYWQ